LWHATAVNPQPSGVDKIMAALAQIRGSNGKDANAPPQ
jgi:hypothetical protein